MGFQCWFTWFLNTLEWSKQGCWNRGSSSNSPGQRMKKNKMCSFFKNPSLGTEYNQYIKIWYCLNIHVCLTYQLHFQPLSWSVGSNFFSFSFLPVSQQCIWLKKLVICIVLMQSLTILKITPLNQARCCCQLSNLGKENSSTGKTNYLKSSIRSQLCIILDPNFPRLVLEVNKQLCILEKIFF